jgi:uncharacterized protein YjdB
VLRLMHRPSRLAGIAAAACSAVAILSCGSSTSPNGPVGSVKVTPPADTVAVGRNTTLQATVMSPGGQVVPGQRVFWNTGKASVATVSDAGVVTGVAQGTVQIAASAGGTSGMAIITVLPPPVSSVSVSPSHATIVLPGTAQLTATPLDANHTPLDTRTVTWASNVPNVANVDASGLVTGVAAGSATITATSEGQSASATIVVQAPVVASVMVTPPTATLTVGDSTTLTAKAQDAAGHVIYGAPITWSADTPSAATVSGSGVVKAVGAGSAIIKAKSGNASGTATIHAVPPPPPPAPAPPPPAPPPQPPGHGHHKPGHGKP